MPCPFFIRDDKKFVTLEQEGIGGQTRDHLDENYFNRFVRPKIPYELRLQALRRGKGVLRTERSYEKKGVTKHAKTGNRN